LTGAIALGALVQDFRFDRLIESERTAASTFDDRVRDLARQNDTLHATRRTERANGQVAADWLDRAREPIAEAEASLANQRSQAAADAPTGAGVGAGTPAVS